jgi:hypothetical protein
MIGWIYLAGALLTYLPLSRNLAWVFTERDDEPEGMDWFFGYMMGAMLTWFWPLAVIVALGDVVPKVGVDRRRSKEIESKKDKARIRELERELDIR